MMTTTEKVVVVLAGGCVYGSFLYPLFFAVSPVCPSFTTHNGIPMGGKLQTETGQLSGTEDMTDEEVARRVVLMVDRRRSASIRTQCGMGIFWATAVMTNHLDRFI